MRERIKLLNANDGHFGSLALTAGIDELVVDLARAGQDPGDFFGLDGFVGLSREESDRIMDELKKSISIPRPFC